MASSGKLLLFSIAVMSCGFNEKTTEASLHSIEAKPAIRKEFWPVEKNIEYSDSVFKVNNALYSIRVSTQSLNDSLAIYKVSDDAGEIEMHAHNRVSRVSIKKNGEKWMMLIFSKALFGGRDKELRLKSSFFRLYDEGKFIFSVLACVPDSDIC